MPNNLGERRSLGIDPALVLKFIATSFFYLLAGLAVFAADILGVFMVSHDAIFVLWLFGFVAMIIFGLSYMFSSGLTRSSAHMKSTVSKEYYLLNAGVILFFTGFSGAVTGIAGKIGAIIGLVSIIIAVSLHLINIALVATTRKVQKSETQSFADDY